MRPAIVDYLRSPEARRAATLEMILQRPDEGFHALLNFRDPGPNSVDSVDAFPDHLAPLLIELLKQHPRLLIDSDLSRFSPGQRWALVAAVMATGNPQFARLLLECLSDRSSDVKRLAIRAISQCAFLQIQEAKPCLEKLWTMKSMAHLRPDIRRALEALQKTASGAADSG